MLKDTAFLGLCCMSRGTADLESEKDEDHYSLVPLP